jgi:hypothetical protein
MSLATRIILTASLALSSGFVLSAQHGVVGHGFAGSGGRAAAAAGYGGQAFAAPPIGTMNSVPPGSSRLYSATSVGTRNAVPPGRARWGYGGGYGYGYYNGYGRGYYRYRSYPFAYWLTPYYYPGLFYDTGPYYGSYDSYPYDMGDVAQNPYVPEQELSQNAPPPYYPPYGPPPPNYYSNPPPSTPPPNAQSSQTQPSPPLTLILRNGEKLQVQNYAVMGQTFWDFSKQPARKIPIGSIDLPASAKATEASGAEFPPIS